jgi:hypothetical protein
MSEMLGKLHGGNPSEGAGRCKVGQDKSHDANGSATSAPFPSTPGFSDRPT